MSGVSFRVALVTTAARGIGADAEPALGYPMAIRAEPRALYGLDSPAAAVCWSCSAESGAVTGTVVHADGGFIG